ncbi:Suppressor of Profilin deletion [Ophidiomyces ophidiicola]|uniref:Suppressor of Profilin deletion n=1 Tax=Ophidiomyces ophidiicola TaxID=1387563 RepID=UPI0020C20643|nr:Suppressor of Profilin deletion [Ophidiomyces ophidiicola]KAI1947109.1 Suppressor of Profilin deletion [Ophidiomyces ophidiicola]KAI2013204.1 Suppressor of Profilin deletion [Ophidiomyces ophidiicola]KAI2059133.1 Suppressor of Profilin deletion [Ophidiomyces ophidiicola]KAI2144461.1 Suppressor of Profilin deletion [Ophidiomyces ophidiicola]KAI2147303.1 Suppressor of Profilin deletion [Ophidiomyces ophidiicola]
MELSQQEYPMLAVSGDLAGPAATAVWTLPEPNPAREPYGVHFVLTLPHCLQTLLPPAQAVAVINDRLKSINKVNQEIADWLQERRRIEEAYFVGLRRLARRPQPEGGSKLGIFEAPWQRILSETESIALSHETLAHHIESDVERPLREYSTKNKDIKPISGAQQDLLAISRSIEAAEKKVIKFKDKGSKALDKLGNASTASSVAKAQWESKAPFVFEQLQAVDEHRLNHLRDVLTQFQTHEADHVERSRQSAENCLNALLAISPSEEIKMFAFRVSGGRTADLESQNPLTAAVSEAEVIPMEPLQAPPRIRDDAGSRRSSHSNQARPSFASEQPPNPQQRHTPLGGLKRLGTVMSRRRSIVQTNSGNASPERKFRSPFTPFRRAESSHSFHQVDNQPGTPNGLEPFPSRDGSSLHRPDSSATTNGSQVGPNIDSRLNGATIPEENIGEETSTTVIASHEGRPLSPKAPIDADGFSTKPDTIDEISRAQQEAASEDPGLNLTIRDQPIQEDEGEAKQAMNDMASTLRLQAKQSGLGRGPGTLRGRRDVRNTIFVPTSIIPEGESNVGTPSKGITDGALSPTTSPSQDPQSAAPSGPSHDDPTISDVTSIHSSHTLHSLSGIIQHPELTAPGLNASIVDKVNITLAGGAVTKSFVVGELALAYNPIEGTSPDKQIVRLDNFHILERVAANPDFVKNLANDPSNGTPPLGITDDRKGEYDVALSYLREQTATVAFKYQIHIDPSSLSAYCPVIFEPVWNEEEFQASVIINYSLNPQFVTSSPLTSVTLQNLILTVNLGMSSIDEETKQPREAARATGALMHPSTGASFRRKTSSVIWKLPVLEVAANGENRLLARFSTATSWPRKGKVEAKFDAIIPDDTLRLGISSHLPATQNESKEVDPFADGMKSPNSQITSPVTATEVWAELPTKRKLSVSRYLSA